MSYDRRQFPRADLVFDVKYRAQDQEVDTFSRDISAGGISFVTQESYAPDSVLAVSFSLKGLAGQIDAMCQVVRSWQDGATTYTAVRFTEIDDMDLVTVTDYSLAMSDEVRHEMG